MALLVLNGNSDSVVRRILESATVDEPQRSDNSRDVGEVLQQAWIVSERYGVRELYEQIISFVLPAVQSVVYVDRSTYEHDEIHVAAMMEALGMDGCWHIHFGVRDDIEMNLELTLATKNGGTGVERLHEVAMGVMASIPQSSFLSIFGPTRPLPAHFDILRSPHCTLTEVGLSESVLNDELVTALAESLVGNSTLLELNLSMNPDVTPLGWRAVANIVSQPLSALEDLNLFRNSINDEVVILIADALVHNSSLKRLNLHENFDITTAGLEAFSRVLWDTTSVLATYESNHTLQRLSWGLVLRESANVKALLQFNQENSGRDVARLKILETHFPDGVVGAVPFIDMDLAFLPHALAWMGREGDGHLYNFLRHVPTLFGK